MNITEQIKAGQIVLNKQHEDGETAKLGNLRGGSAGCITSTGSAYGKCGRLHWLRSMGINLPMEDYVHPMFDAGLANEDSVYNVLNAAIEHDPDTTILREEEIPVVWELDNGVKATGRPDIVYTDKDGKATVGLELKNISSIHTARNVIADFKPGSDHLVQAAFYSYKLGQQQDSGPIAYKLIYTSAQYWHIPFSPKYLAEAFQDRHTLCEHKGDRPFRVLPGRFVYELTWDDASDDGHKLFYGMEGCDKQDRVETAITTKGIDTYYNTLSEQKNSDKLMPRPSNKHVSGAKSYSQCDYCALKPTCKEKENDKDNWLDTVKLEIKA